jgi:hypothetical protein
MILATNALAVAGIAALAPIAAVVASHLLARRKIQEVHVLVNNRLSIALAENKVLKAALAKHEPEIALELAKQIDEIDPFTPPLDKPPKRKPG